MKSKKMPQNTKGDHEEAVEGADPTESKVDLEALAKEAAKKFRSQQ